MNQGTSCNLSSIKWFNKHVKLLYLKLDSIYGSHPRKWTRLYNWVRRIHVWKQKKQWYASQLQLKFFFIGVYVYSLHSMELQNELRNMLKGS